MTQGEDCLVLFGVEQSYFTRKMSGYLDYKQIPWRLRRFGGGNPEVRAAGWSGVMQRSIHRLGATAENIDSWIEEVLKPWQALFSAHLTESSPYLFGGRPSLADFAFFGGNAAHFINDPLCRRWTDEVGPAVVKHTHRLMQPDDEKFGDWSTAVPDSLVALLTELGRLYLPWVSRATRDGSAVVGFASGAPATIETTAFLDEARGILLARYLELRSDALDTVLERAGILGWLADHTSEAGSIPAVEKPRRPSRNQPFAANP